MYKLKHKPSGLYYQPGPNNLSVRGKIYQTATNAISGYKQDDKFIIHVEKGGTIYKQYSNLNWEPDGWRFDRVRIVTSFSDL